MSAPAHAVGTTVDPAIALTTIAAVAATFVAVWLYFYLPLTSASGRWFIRRTLQRIAHSRRLLVVRRIGRALWLIDVAVVLSSRLCLALYTVLILLVVIPALLAIGSLALAASLIHF